MSAVNDSGEDRFDRGGNRGDDTSPDVTPAEDTGDPLVATAMMIVAGAALLGSMVIAYVLSRVLTK